MKSFKEFIRKKLYPYPTDAEKQKRTREKFARIAQQGRERNTTGTNWSNEIGNMKARAEKRRQR